MNTYPWSYNHVAEIKTVLQYPLPSILVSVKSGQALCSGLCQYFPLAAYIQNMSFEKYTNYFRNSSLFGKLGNFKGDRNHPFIAKATLSRWNEMIAMYADIRPAWKEQFRMKKANKSCNKSNYSSKISFGEFETDSKLLTYLNWFLHTYSASVCMNTHSPLFRLNFHCIAGLTIM